MPAFGRPRRIVVLGGGASALSAVFHITDRPEWRRWFDITVYQMGWRLGGKGASGRNLQQHARIEEHGLHVWPGFYDHSFRMMRRCWEEYAPLGLSKFQDWSDGFVPQRHVVLHERAPIGGNRGCFRPGTCPVSLAMIGRRLMRFGS